MGTYNLCVVFLVSSVISFAITPAAIFIAKKIKVVDYPGRTRHTIHNKAVPRAGGIAMCLALLVLYFLFKPHLDNKIAIILISALIIFAFGLWDDRFGVNASVKLIGQALAVTILVLNDVRVRFVENPKFFITLNSDLATGVDIFITYFWIIAITNAFNLIDSMDGLALGIAQIGNAFFLLSFWQYNQNVLATLALILFGVNFGIFFYNKLPAKIFLGDSGAQTLGFILSVLAILYHPVGAEQSSTWFIPILVFGVPIFDTTLVTFSRLRRKLPVYKANLDHTYHRLVQFGLSSKNAVVLMHLVSVIFAIIAYTCVRMTPLSANIIFALWLTFFFFALYFFESRLEKSKSI